MQIFYTRTSKKSKIQQCYYIFSVHFWTTASDSEHSNVCIVYMNGKKNKTNSRTVVCVEHLKLEIHVYPHFIGTYQFRSLLPLHA